ncbi:MAG: hypothetical protein RI885_2538 [Actinomycetota bacterium]
MTQLGQYAPPVRTIAHFSDPHFLAGGRQLYGVVDTTANLVAALAQLERSGVAPNAIVFTGDLADLAEPDAYRRLRDVVEPVAERLGSQLVWVMGNHDERRPFGSGLFDEPGLSGGRPDSAMPPRDRVYDLDGLRLIALDTSVPGYHHGELDDSQLEWLANELRTPAPLGTLIALHHPPLPSTIEVMAILELQEQQRLAEVIRGTDARGILAGHLHYQAHGMFAGVPVSVAAATCYSLDVGAPVDRLSGVDGGQAFSLVNVYADQIVHSTVPLGRFAEVSGFSDTFARKIASLSPEQRREAFSNKSSTMTVADIENL